MIGSVNGVSTGTDALLEREPGLLRGLIAGMRCGIIAVDREHRLLLLNETAASILDLPEPALPGMPVERALVPHRALARILVESFSMRDLPNRAEIELHPRSARSRAVGFTVSRIHDADGAVCGVAMFFKDLTQIEHHEAQERMQDRLAALGEMAASLAHEIRNPLAAIEISCGLLRRRVGDPEGAAGLLDKITAEVRRLNETVTSSLELVRPICLSFSPASLQDVVDEAWRGASARRARPGIAVRTELDRSMAPFLMDRDRLRQAFEHLLLNALEAVGSGGGTVHVESGTMRASSDVSVPYGARSAARRVAAEQFAVVRIADSGPGIPHRDRERIFSPFFSTKNKGPGVGLSLVKKILDGHGGLIDVDSSEEGGALFTVRLPMAPAEV